MSEFFVGQKVVCIETPEHDEADWGIEEFPKKDAVYTIRKAITFKDEVGLRLVEIVNPVLAYECIGEIAFSTVYFRPLETKSISIFRAIAQGVTDGKPIVPDERYEFDKRAVEVIPFIGRLLG